MCSLSPPGAGHAHLRRDHQVAVAGVLRGGLAVGLFVGLGGKGGAPHGGGARLRYRRHRVRRGLLTRRTWLESWPSALVMRPEHPTTFLRAARAAVQ